MLIKISNETFNITEGTQIFFSKNQSLCCQYYLIKWQKFIKKKKLFLKFSLFIQSDDVVSK